MAAPRVHGGLTYGHETGLGIPDLHIQAQLAAARADWN